jgi:hypothetical protein
MEPGEFKIVIHVDGVKSDGTPMEKDFVMAPLTERVTQEALVGISNLFVALVND